MATSENLVYTKSAIPTVIDPTVELKSNIDESNEKIDINTAEIESMKCSIEKLEEKQDFLSSNIDESKEKIDFLSNDISELDFRTKNNIETVYSYIRDTHNKIEEERLDDMTYIKGYIIKAACLSSSIVFVLNIIAIIIINFFK